MMELLNDEVIPNCCDSDHPSPTCKVVPPRVRPEVDRPPCLASYATIHYESHNLLGPGVCTGYVFWRQFFLCMCIESVYGLKMVCVGRCFGSNLKNVCLERRCWEQIDALQLSQTLLCVLHYLVFS